LRGARAVTDPTQDIRPIIEEAAERVGLKASIKEMRRLSGGAINQNFLAELTDGSDQTHRWVLRRGQSLPIPGSLNRAAEFAVVSHAEKMGVAVAKPITLIEHESNSASVFQWCSGQTDGRAILSWLSKSDQHANAEKTKRLTQSLGVQLARLHSTQSAETAAKTLTTHLGPRPDDGFAASIDLLKRSFSKVKAPKSYLIAAYEACLNEAETIQRARGQTKAPACIAHNDFRLGNLMIDPSTSQLTAVLDWEFTAWGDPMADIGWVSAPCWRFGGSGPVAGFGAVDDLLTGYASACADAQAIVQMKARVAGELGFWQRYAHLRWAVIAAQQGERAISGDVEALELLLTGAMVASILEPTLAHYWGSLPTIALGERDAPEPAHAALDQLLAEAAHHLKSYLGAQLSGSQRYSALMSANAIRLARGGLRLKKNASVHSNATDQARHELAADLAVWSFRG